MTAKVLTPRQAKELKSKQLRARLLSTMGVLTVVGMLACGYGHAAVNAELYIEGEASIKKSGGEFTSVYMQDVTPEECESVADDVTTQLIDKRDGKKYWVAKFRDGGCWMTQDLQFDLVADENGKVELTSELTDINPSEDNWTLYEEEVKNGKTILKWNENSYYPPYATDPYGNIGQKNNTTYSIHLETDFIIKRPLVVKSGRMAVVDWDENGNKFWLYQPVDNLPNGVSRDDETMTFDSRYLMGTYYQFNAAAAGSRNAKEEAVSSICPRGWALPRWGDAGDTDKLAMFPIDTMTYYKADGGNYHAWPFYFSEASYYINSGVDTVIVGQSTYYWTSWSASGTNAGYISAHVGGNSAVHANLSNYWGMQVRCGLRMN